MGVKLIVGIPGTGKNTYATTLAIQYMKRGYEVFSTYPIKAKIYIKFKLTCNVLNIDDLKTKIFPSGSKIFIDEAHLSFNSRDSVSKTTNNFTKEMREFLTYVRHLDNDIYIICQMASSVDKYLREYAEEIIFLKYINPKFLFPNLRRRIIFYSSKDFEHHDWGELHEKGLIKSNLKFLNKSVWRNFNSKYGRDKIARSREQVKIKKYEYFEDIKIIHWWDKLYAYFHRKFILYKDLKKNYDINLNESSLITRLTLMLKLKFKR